MIIYRVLQRLKANQSGSTVIEFALLAPIFIASTMGILQVGMSTWRYNSLRGVAADLARYAVVNYQQKSALALKTTDLAADDLETYGRTMATTSPYSLPAADLTLTVTPVVTSRVAGTIEMTIMVQSQVPSIVPFVDLSAFTISYSRPAFLIVNS